MHLGPYINLVSPTDPYCADNFYSSNDIYGTSSYSGQSYQLDECSAAPRDPAGGVMASAVDMANFARGLLDSYHGRGGLLSKTGIRDLWKPTHDFGCTTNCTYQRYYATGFFVATPAGKPVIEVEHGGSRAGFHTVFVLRPEADTAVCILVNGHVNLSAMNKVAKTILDDFAKPLQGQVRAYGKGCPGTASGQQVCASINTSGTNQTSTTYANGQYAIQVTATTGMSVSGFELHCDGGQTVTTSILAADSAGKPGTVLVTSSMQVGATRNWYATTFAKPVSIAKGQRFFLSFTNSAKSINASLKSGSKVAYFARPVNGAWFSASANWTYKIQCPTTTSAVPNLGAPSRSN
jgi:hypothetical protein